MGLISMLVILAINPSRNKKKEKTRVG